MSGLDTAILFLVFNRPETTKQVFEKIRDARPRKLYIAADGHRAEKQGEKEKTIKVRAICTAIDWDCELHTLFRDQNLGCGKAVSQGISWFFENETEGIILEDDCLPDSSFFRFCAELLIKYRHEDKVMSISGSNLLGYPWKVEGQSYFWGQGGIWGWATWKRAWALYDFKMEGWRTNEVKEKIKKGMFTEEWYQFYYPMFEATYSGSLDTWDIQWFYSILLNDGLSANPELNLVKNIGFGQGATHTEGSDRLADLTIAPISFPLKHPAHRIVDTRHLSQMHAALQPAKKKAFILKRILNLFRR